MVVHACNPSTGEVEAGESQVPGQPGPHNKTVSEKVFRGWRCSLVAKRMLSMQECWIQSLAPQN
jgi:hypothetical protein